MSYREEVRLKQYREYIEHSCLMRKTFEKMERDESAESYAREKKV